jgi:hypothetical protein
LREREREGAQRISWAYIHGNTSEVQAAGDPVRRGAEPHAEPADEPGCPIPSPQDHSPNAARPPITSHGSPTNPSYLFSAKEGGQGFGGGAGTPNSQGPLRVFAAVRRHERDECRFNCERQFERKSSISNFQVNYRVKQTNHILYSEERRKESIQPHCFNLE